MNGTRCDKCSPGSWNAAGTSASCQGATSLPCKSPISEFISTSACGLGNGCSACDPEAGLCTGCPESKFLNHTSACWNCSLSNGCSSCDNVTGDCTSCPSGKAPNGTGCADCQAGMWNDGTGSTCQGLSPATKNCLVLICPSTRLCSSQWLPKLRPIVRGLLVLSAWQVHQRHRLFRFTFL